MGTPSDGEDDERVDSRQLFLAGVCLFGLVTAAMLAPVSGENEPIGVDGGAVPTDLVADFVEFLIENAPDSDDESDDPESRDEDGGDGGGGTVPDWLRDLADYLPGIDPDDGREGDGQGSGPTNPCQVYVGGDPNPGSEATVLVLLDGEPVSDVRVWFNDEYVGRTDEQGTVTGEVPYVEQLEVRVESPTDRACAFSREPASGGA